MKIQIFHNEIYVGNAELCIGVGTTVWYFCVLRSHQCRQNNLLLKQKELIIALKR